MWDTLPWCRGQTGSSRDVSVGNKVGSLQVVQTELPPPPRLSDAHAGGPTQGPRTSESRGSIVGGGTLKLHWQLEKLVRREASQTFLSSDLPARWKPHRGVLTAAFRLGP